MKNLDRAIEGIRVKVQRAYDHFHDLCLRVQVWSEDEANPNHVSITTQPNGRFHVYTLHFDRPLPVEWDIIFGEAIHDLQSALDSCIFQLYRANNGGAESTKTAFPIFEDPEKFSTGGERRIEGIGVGPRAFIKSLQPYPGRRHCVPNERLADLHDFWNRDKHCEANMFGLWVSVDKAEIPSGCILFPTGLRRVHYDTAEAFLIVTTKPTFKMNVKPHIGIHATIARREARGDGTWSSQFDLYGVVKTITDALVASIGHQDGPIVVAWPEDGVFDPPEWRDGRAR